LRVLFYLNNMQHTVDELNEKHTKSRPEETLKFFLDQYPGQVTLGSSLGAEDQVLLDMMSKCCCNFSVFTLDTGRLFPETYDLIDVSNKRYNMAIKVFFPDSKQVEEMVNTMGINLFYESIENRKRCCYLRKVEPLKRALPGNKVWVTGLRKDQSLQRFYTKLVEWDEGYNIIKVNPLLNWSEKEVWAYLKENHVPYNRLHDKGFPSIGCQPCTRAIEPGEDIRAGRWWWESSENNECGLHEKKE
jgi:phosphoadenosine phosphosulfate reductase